MGLTICAILGFTIALSSLLNYVNFERSYSDMVRSAHTVVLRDIGYGVQYGLGLGLSLPAMDNIAAVIDAVAAEDDNILAIRVFGPQGRTLFDTDPQRIGTAVPGHWQELAFGGGSADGVWNADVEGADVIGLTLINNFDVVEGGLALVFSRAEAETAFARIRVLLVKQSLITLAVFGMLSMVLAWLITRRLSRSLQRMEASLAAVDAGREPTVTAASAGNAFEQEFAAFQEAVRETTDELERADGKASR